MFFEEKEPKTQDYFNYNYDFNRTYDWQNEECAIQKFFENERITKPPHLRCQSACIACFCSKCRVIL